MLLEMGTRFDPRDVHEIKLASGTTTVTDGQGISSLVEGGETVGRVTTGSGEKFHGVAQGRLKYPSTAIVTELLTASSTTLTLTYTPASSTDLSIYANSGAGTKQAAGTPGSNANEYSISGKVVTLHSGQADTTLLVIYRRSITVTEAQALYGHGINVSPLEATEIANSVSVIRKGTVYTDQCDLSSDWRNAHTGAVYCKANGLFTLASSSALALPYARIVAVPTADVPYLGLEFSAY